MEVGVCLPSLVLYFITSVSFTFNITSPTSTWKKKYQVSSGGNWKIIFRCGELPGSFRPSGNTASMKFSKIYWKCATHWLLKSHKSRFWPVFEKSVTRADLRINTNFHWGNWGNSVRKCDRHFRQTTEDKWFKSRSFWQKIRKPGLKNKIKLFQCRVAGAPP